MFLKYDTIHLKVPKTNKRSLAFAPVFSTPACDLPSAASESTPWCPSPALRARAPGPTPGGAWTDDGAMTAPPAPRAPRERTGEAPTPKRFSKPNVTCQKANL